MGLPKSPLSVLVLALWAGPAAAQVTEVVVGVTPNCPYGLSACWGGAHEALGRLEGVRSVAKTPDAYNCTAHVHLKDKGLPNIEKWPEQFQAVVGKTYAFRGVEVTIKATVQEKDGSLVLEAPGLTRQVTLGPLEHKLQWNFKKGDARQPEPDERNAYKQLAARRKKAKVAGAFRAEVTGPLRVTDRGVVLEVREFTALPAVAPRP
jgi:hypothetical protein